MHQSFRKLCPRQRENAKWPVVLGVGSWLSRSQRESPYPAGRLSCPELPSSYPEHRWVSPCSGPNTQPPCGDKIKRQRLRPLCGEKHEPPFPLLRTFSRNWSRT